MQFCVISTNTASSCPKAAFSRSNSVVSQSVCRTRVALVTISSPLESSVKMFSFSKYTPIPFSFSLRITNYA